METKTKTKTKSKTFSFVVRTNHRLLERYNRFIANPFGVARTAITFVALASCVWIVWLTLQPHLIFTNTTATGGDMGAHVWWPAYMKDVLLPHGRLFGWTMDYYAGFPAGQYYFPVPAIMIVIFNILLPYNIAFKLGTVVGSVTLPIAAYILGRSIRAPKPVPLFMGFAATAFLFFGGDPRVTQTGSTLANYSNANFNERIMGGPLLSAMAGEFSFSIALTFGLLFLGAFYVMLRDGKYRTRVAVLFALTVMSHLVVAIFLGIAAMVFWGSVYAARKGLFRWLGYALLGWICVLCLSIGAIGRYFFDHKTSGELYFVLLSTIAVLGVLVFGFVKHRDQLKQVVRDAIPIIVGLLLSSVWLLPLFARFVYTSNMRYEKLADLPSTPGVNEVYELYIAPHYFLWPVLIPAAIGFILSAMMLRKSIVPIIVTAGAMAVVFIEWPEGHAWNLRFLPFWFLFLYFVAAAGYGEMLRLPISVMSRLAYAEKNKKHLHTLKYVRVGFLAVSCIFFFVMLVGIGNPTKIDKTSGTNANCRGGFEDKRAIFKDRRGVANCWAAYNFSGYEKKPAWPEFNALIDKLKTLPPGRAMWEPSTGAYGTTIALMLIPYFTNHKISSMEGLYYEAAGTTAYHFLTVAEVSKTPSNPMRWPKCPTKVDGTKVDPACFDSYYGTIADFHRGVAHMQMLGVTYYLAETPEAKAAADLEPDLKLIATTPDIDKQDPFGWNIYKVLNTSYVEPIAQNPVVITDKVDAKDWEQSGNKWLYDWFNAPGRYPVFVNGGPDTWKKETAKEALSKELSSVDQSRKSTVKVSKVKLSNDGISFHVDKIGEPVMVKVSYYPTFVAKGAGKIYRASPNFMVVVPTKHDVSITSERDAIEWFADFLFLLGIVGVGGLYVTQKRSLKQLSALITRKH